MEKALNWDGAQTDSSANFKRSITGYLQNQAPGDRKFQDWISVKAERERKLAELMNEKTRLEDTVEQLSRRTDTKLQINEMNKQMRAIDLEIFDLKKELQSQKGL